MEAAPIVETESQIQPPLLIHQASQLMNNATTPVELGLLIVIRARALSVRQANTGRLMLKLLLIVLAHPIVETVF